MKDINGNNWVEATHDINTYPIGTKYKAIGGGYWIKNERGYKWCTGNTFPTVGGDWSGSVCFPIKPKNSEILVGDIFDKTKFISGKVYWKTSWAKIKGQKIKPGQVVQYDLKSFVVDWIIITEDGDVEVSLANTPLGRVPLEELDEKDF